MGTVTCPEVRTEFHISEKDRAKARDSFVRSFERQFSDWTEIAKVCIEVERDRDFEILGFPSWNAWLLNAAPRSRAYIYLVVGRYKELIPDIPESELAEMPITSTTVLRQLSPAVRAMSNIRQVAKKGPKELREVIQKEYPMQHIEGIVEQRLRFTTSQWSKIESAYEAYKVLNPYASLEIFFEFCVSEISDGI